VGLFSFIDMYRKHPGFFYRSDSGVESSQEEKGRQNILAEVPWKLIVPLRGKFRVFGQWSIKKIRVGTLKNKVPRLPRSRMIKLAETAGH
jgi:hypothetical protein